MSTEDLRKSITDRMETLEQARARQREADNEVQRLKVEIGTLQSKLAATQIDKLESGVSDFSHIVGIAVDSW